MTDKLVITAMSSVLNQLFGIKYCKEIVISLTRKLYFANSFTKNIFCMLIVPAILSSAPLRADSLASSKGAIKVRDWLMSHSSSKALKELNQTTNVDDDLDLWSSPLMAVGKLSAYDEMPVRKLLTQVRAGAKLEAFAAEVSLVKSTPETELLDPISEKIPEMVETQNKEQLKQKTKIIVRLDEKGRIALAPKEISFTEVGQDIALEFEGSVDSTKLQVFVRDHQFLDWQDKKLALRSKSLGQTEIYFIYQKEFKAVPVVIGSALNKTFASNAFNQNQEQWHAAGYPSLGVPAELTDLSKILSQSGNSEELISGDKTVVASQQLASASFRKMPTAMSDAEKKALMTLENYERQTRMYAKEEKKAEYAGASIQLIDERSVPAKGIIYPVGGVLVHVVGTEFSGQTSSTGRIDIPDLPVDSRFLITVEDPQGAYVRSVSEFVIDIEGRVHHAQITILRKFTQDMLADVVGSVQIESRGSICGTVYGEQGYVLNDYSVSLDVDAEGPFYFNKFGYLDKTQQATGLNGRFCYFNIPSGPFSIELQEVGEGYLGMVPESSFAGFHKEIEIDVSSSSMWHIKTRLAAVATAHEQLSGDQNLADHYQPIDMIDVLPFGFDTPLSQVDFALVASPDPLLSYQARIYAFSRASEFEQAIYSYNTSDQVGIGEHITPLIPRGFVEDMAIMANVTFNPILGAVLIEHGKISGQGVQPSDVKLVDINGRKVGEGWYYSDDPITKAIFFNVHPGKYAVLVETKDGYWLSSDTVLVYNESVSYARLGSRTRYRSGQ